MRTAMFVLLAFLSHSIVLANSVPKLVVHMENGVKFSYTLNERVKIKFRDKEIAITSRNVEICYPLEKMIRFAYENVNTPTSIDLNTERPSVQIGKDALLFPNLKAGDVIAVYSTGGSLLMKKTIQHSGEYSFSLSGLYPNTYIVSVNELTYKFIKR